MVLLFSALVASTAALAKPSLFDELPPSDLTFDTAVLGRTAEESVNDPLVDNQWHLNHIYMGNAWDIMSRNLPPPPNRRKPITLAVIYEGMDVTHPDLQGMLWSDSDGGHGLNFIDHNKILDDNDITGQGTLLSGILGAQLNNSVGVAGVAGIHGQLELMTLKVDFLDVDQVVLAIKFAVKTKVDIVYIPWTTRGLGDKKQKLLDAMMAATAAGVFFVSAAGSQSDNLKRFPCGFKFRNSLCVAGISKKDTLLPYTNWGKHIDVAAPGDVIFSTADTKLHKGNEYTLAISGSAPAAAIVAGLVAILLYLGVPPESVRGIIVDSADDDFNPRDKRTIAGGIVNAKKAVEDAVGKMG